MKQKRIIIFFSLVVILAFVNWFCSKPGTKNPGGGGPAGGTPNAVSIYNMAFSPSSLTVKAGTKVTWTNNDGYAHTVTSDDGTSFSSGNVAGSGTFAFTPTTPATYKYHCNIHSGMTGTIIVTQ